MMKTLKSTVVFLLLSFSAYTQTEMKLSLKFLNTKLKPMSNTKVLLTEIETREQLEAITNSQGVANFHIKSGNTWQIEVKKIQNYPRWRTQMIQNRIVETKRTLTYDLERYKWDMTAPADKASMDLKVVKSNTKSSDTPTKTMAIGEVILKRKSGAPLANFPVKLFSEKQATEYQTNTDAKGVARFILPLNDTYDIHLENMERFNYLKIPHRSGKYYRSITFEPMNFEESIEQDTIRQNLPSNITPTSARQLVSVQYIVKEEGPMKNQTVHLKDDRGFLYLAQTDENGVAKYMLPMGRNYVYVASASGIIEDVIEVIDLKYSFGIGSSRRSIQIDPAIKPRPTKLSLAIPKKDAHLNQFFGNMGITFSNFQNKSVPYYSKSHLIYEDPDNSIGIQKGFMLTTGSIFKAIGPNDLPGASYQNSYYLAKDIPKALQMETGKPKETVTINGEEESELGFGAYDVCWLEFDVTPKGTSLIFEYVFASEEYPEYLQFDDAFGIFVSGENLNGEQNWATTPTQQNVSVAHVNPTKEATLYWANDDSTKASFNTWQYDGFTKKMTSKIPVQAGKTYHVKLLIFDRRDGIYDSAAFIGIMSE